MRTPNHVAQSLNGSAVVHAAHDLTGFGRPLHVLACNGRAMEAAAWNGTVEDVTCRGCKKALSTGKAVWVGKTALPATTTALDAARHNLRWALRNGKPWDQIRHLRANVARAEGTRYYPDRLNEGDLYWYVFDLLATGGPGPATFVQHHTKTWAQKMADEKNGGVGR